MANTNKTKAEILHELESIKGLLLEVDDIPILSDMDESSDETITFDEPAHALQHSSSALPGQVSLFDESAAAINKIAHPLANHEVEVATNGTEQHLAEHHLAEQQSAENEPRQHGFAAHIQSPHPHNPARPLAKASGENPFLPQHIRERLHGNNPPPLFEYETAKKIISATKNINHKINQPRQHLVDEVVHSMMPQIEAEMRHRLFAMSIEDLEKLLHEDEV